MAEVAADPELEEADEQEEPKKAKPKEGPKCEAGAPAWMATFADMATLLMAFFVLILSFTEMEDPSITKNARRNHDRGLRRAIRGAQHRAAHWREHDR